MSEDHKPTREDEAKRIRDAGGFVINNRVMGELAVSRAFGDVDFKKGLQVGSAGNVVECIKPWLVLGFYCFYVLFIWVHFVFNSFS